MVFLDSYRTFLGKTDLPYTDLSCPQIPDLCILSTDDLCIRPVNNFYSISTYNSNRFDDGTLKDSCRVMGDIGTFVCPGQALQVRRKRTRVSTIFIDYGFHSFQLTLRRTSNHYMLFECDDIPLFKYLQYGYGNLKLMWLYYIGATLVVYLMDFGDPDIKIFLFFNTRLGTLVSWCCDGKGEDIASPDLATRAKFTLFRGR